MADAFCGYYTIATLHLSVWNVRESTVSALIFFVFRLEFLLFKEGWNRTAPMGSSYLFKISIKTRKQPANKDLFAGCRWLLPQIRQIIYRIHPNDAFFFGFDVLVYFIKQGFIFW